MMWIKDNEKINGKRLVIEDRVILNPSEEQLRAAGYEPYVAPVVDPEPYIPTEEDKEDMYHSKVEELIREKYTVSDELGFLRQRTVKLREFNAYDEFVEECKTKAHNEVWGTEEE